MTETIISNDDLKKKYEKIKRENSFLREYAHRLLSIIRRFDMDGTDIEKIKLFDDE